MILKVDLDNFVAESEHDSVLGSHPLLHIDLSLPIVIQTIFFPCDLCLLGIVLKVRSEVLKEGDFLL